MYCVHENKSNAAHTFTKCECDVCMIFVENRAGDGVRFLGFLLLLFFCVFRARWNMAGDVVSTHSVSMENEVE